MSVAPEQPARFVIYRGADAPDLAASGIERATPRPPAMLAAIGEAVAAGYGAGARSRVLFAAPGFSLVHVWFKAGFALPLHSHDAPCLYHLLAGSLRIGTETVAAGDGFFLGKDVPYAYVAGEDGVELLEFRTAAAFDNRLLAGAGFWRRAAAIARERRGGWDAAQVSPTGLFAPAAD